MVLINFCCLIFTPEVCCQASKPSKKPKKEHVSKAELIRQQHAAKKRVEKDTSNESWWREQVSAMKSQTVSEQLAQLDRLSNNPRFVEGWLAIESELYRLHLHFSNWVEDPDILSTDLKKVSAVRDKFTLRIMRTVKDMFERGDLFPSALVVLNTTLRAIGFATFYESLLSSSPTPQEEDHALSFKFKKLLRSKTKSPVYPFMPITEDPVEWQLRLFGEYMDRSMDSAYDSRVAFQPDAWQREVLDCLDQKGHSVLVVG